MNESLQKFNGMNAALAQTLLAKCCQCQNWIEAMLAARPFESTEQLRKFSTELWFSLTESDWLEAFKGHPKIGDLESLKKKFAQTAQLAGKEQGQVANTDPTVLHELAGKNQQYENKNGFIFIVCATGKSALEMLEILDRRLKHPRHEEIHEAARQQDLITRLRLESIICPN